MSDFTKATCDALEVSGITLVEEIQSLWSGYGKILRYQIDGSSPKRTVIIKHVAPPTETNHPRGWNTDISHERKLKSYQVESNWYKEFSFDCDDHCRVPTPYLINEADGHVWMAMEDIDGAGFHKRKSRITAKEMNPCLKWLAHFHAKFMKRKPEGLWAQGTYWHLDTRPDELGVLDDIPLKEAAPAIDEKLKNVRHKTFVHGDAKLANFCFSDEGTVAAVDFQYVGGGCGMKDVAYFISSCLNTYECIRLESQVLNTYFNYLKDAIKLYNRKVDCADLETEWRELYPYACADFHRFIKGWSPDHWKINSYSEQITRQVIKELN